MDEVTIQKIAAEVVRHLPNYAWVLLLVQGGIMAAAAAAGAFFGEYLKTRGKNLATKADFESLQEQLRATTQTVETIKSEVAQKDWAQREWTNLRRTKLEALLERMHDCECEEVPRDRDPLSELDTIATLYFPELRAEVAAFIREGRTEAMASLKFRHVRVTEPDQEVVKRRVDEFYASLEPIRLTGVRRVEVCRRLLVEIMGMD
jgi:hypothetical protein